MTSRHLLALLALLAPPAFAQDRGPVETAKVDTMPSRTANIATSRSS